jgi:hypothetical protein
MSMSTTRKDNVPKIVVENEERVVECACEDCQQVIRARSFPLLELAYQLHKRDHEIEKQKAANQFRMVRSGSGWILAKSVSNDLKKGS